MSSPSSPASEPALAALARAIEGRPDAAEMFYQLAETHWRQGDADGYGHFFRRAFLLSPVSHIGQSAEISSYAMESAAALNARARALVARDCAFTPALAALAISEALLGADATARRLMDHDRLVRQGSVAPPQGMSLEALNAAVAGEIRSGKRFYSEPNDRAIRHAWRFNGLARSDCPNLAMLMALLRTAVADYIGALPDEPDHPFLAARPQRFEVGGWAVVSDARGYHESHLHPRAWATGVYYVVQPEVSRREGSTRGWLRLAPPPGLEAIGEEVWPRRLIEPVAGRFVLMPGYFWHETEPMGVDQERICIAFEVRRPELALNTRDGH